VGAAASAQPVSRAELFARVPVQWRLRDRFDGFSFPSGPEPGGGGGGGGFSDFVVTARDLRTWLTSVKYLGFRRPGYTFLW